MFADVEELIHQAIETETVYLRESKRYEYIKPEKVAYIVHEGGVSAYLGDFHLGEFATQTEAIREVRDMAEHYI